ncbi:MAG: hypothetical protein ABFS24_02650 [Pseudomonadota bacterium]
MAGVTVQAVILLIFGSAGFIFGVAHGANPGSTDLIGDKIQEKANAVLALMGYAVVPDVTTSSLSIQNNATANPGFKLTQMAGGFTFSQSVPLYLEGSLAYSRYDPTFSVGDDLEDIFIPVKWDSLMAGGGIGWDFPIVSELVFRPVFNMALGHVESDLSGLVDDDDDLGFLDDGRLNVVGYGGSFMLDYSSHRPAREIDVEWRLSGVRMQSFGNTSSDVRGRADTLNTNLWARWRAPTGYTLLQGPLRYVLEGAHSTFFGAQAGILGFNHLTSLGAGIELDSSAYDIYVTRARLVGRYVFGQNIRGVSIGLAINF